MDVLRIAQQFRKAMDDCKSNFQSTGLKHWPRGASMAASNLLGQYLLDQHQLEADFVAGWTPTTSHNWLEVAGVKCDITGDEIGAEAVIVQQASLPHDRFLVVQRRRAGLVALPGLTVTPAEYQMVCERMKV